MLWLIDVEIVLEKAMSLQISRSRDFKILGQDLELVEKMYDKDFVI